MRIRNYIKHINLEAMNIYRRFLEKNGAEHISSPIGIHLLLKMCREEKPKRVLEVGGGIGTLSFAVLKHTNARIDIFEDHPFCINELKKNLAGYEERYTVLTDYENFTLPSREYDIVIVDGGNRKLLGDLIRRTGHIGRILTEGSRGEQQKVMRRALSKKYVFRPRYYNDAFKRFKGASEIVCYQVKNAPCRVAAYIFWEICIFKEIKLFLRYRFSLLFKKIKDLFQ